jgi:hypothetical protein
MSNAQGYGLFERLAGGQKGSLRPRLPVLFDVGLAAEGKREEPARAEAPVRSTLREEVESAPPAVASTPAPPRADVPGIRIEPATPSQEKPERPRRANPPQPTAAAKAAPPIVVAPRPQPTVRQEFHPSVHTTRTIERVAQQEIVRERPATLVAQPALRPAVREPAVPARVVGARASAPSPLRLPGATEESRETIIDIHIGRLEVRSAPAQSTPPAPAPVRIDDRLARYLRSRAGGARS